MWYVQCPPNWVWQCWVCDVLKQNVSLLQDYTLRMYIHVALAVEISMELSHYNI